MNYRLGLLTTACLASLTMSAQSYVGLLGDNYSGVHGIINNPSSIADSHYKADINLVGVSTTIGTDLMTIGLGGGNEDNLTLSTDNNIFINQDILGPSFLINLNDDSAIAISTRVRSYLNGYGIDGQSYDTIDTNLDSNADFNLETGGANLSLNSWVELGATYSRVLLDKDEHFLKAGATVKYLQGVANGYASISGLSVDYDSTNFEIETSGTATAGASGDIEDITQVADVFEDFSYDTVKAFTGVGLDLGATYEWRPDNARSIDNPNEYKLKVGVAITDIGSISYEGTSTSYDLNNRITREEFQSIDSIETLEQYYTGGNAELESGNLPTTFRLNTDWNVNNDYFYLNFNADLSMVSSGLNRIHNVNMLTVTPRYETKWITAQLPISVQQYTGVQAGFGFRAGPLYLGSGTILTNLLTEGSSLDIYAGLKIPLYKKKN